jgi:ABC-2 type transport system ATP-binding protein
MSIRDLGFRYPGAATPALDGVTLSVLTGEMIALLGPNGSGKSTLMRLLAQVERAERGTLEVLGCARASEIRPLLGVVFQTTSLDPRLTVGENLEAYALLNGLGLHAADRIAALQSSMGLADRARARVGTLSLGLARRVDLCRALLHRPSLLLLDEPTTGLDPPSREGFLSTIDSVRRDEGATVLLSTHLVDEAERCDRVVLMHQGRVAAEGAPAALRAGLGRRLLTVSGGPAPPALPGIEASAWTRRALGWTTPLPSDDPPGTEALASTVAALLSTDPQGGRSLTIAPPSLADLFAALTGQELATAPPEAAARAGRTAGAGEGRR